MSEYHTTDIILASVLKVNNVKFLGINVTGKRGTFLFEDAPADLLSAFDLSQCRVEPVQFNNTIKQLTTAVRRLSNDKV